MVEKLSIITGDEEIEIESNKSDYAALLIKGLLGVAPIVGPIMAETLANSIPNQKLDRVIEFTKILESKLNRLDESVIRIKFKTEKFTDLLEDALLQASRAFTNERRQYLATFLATSITTDEALHLQEKRILAVLGELNDAEIIALKWCSLLKKDEIRAEEFLEQHSQVILKGYHEYIIGEGDGMDYSSDTEIILENYMEHLKQLDLIIVHSSPFADLLLRYIGIAEDSVDNPS